MDLFKPDDFFAAVPEIDGVVSLEFATRSADIANRLLKEQAVRVYGFGSDSEFWQTQMDHRYLQYHKALVVCVEPVKEED